MQQKPHRWNISPALIAPKAHSLWTGLAFIAPLWPGAGKGALLGALGQPLAGSNLIAGSTLQWRGTPYGLGVGISGASNLLYQDNFAPITTSNGAGTGDFTIVQLANPPAEAAVTIGVGQSVSGGNPRVDFFLNSNGAAAASGSFEFWVSGVGLSVAGAIDGKFHLFAARRAVDRQVWIDGVKRATGTGVGQDIWDGASGFALGSRAESTANRINTATTIVLTAAWNRALSDAELRMLARDPFCMFRPAAEWRGVWTALGGNVTLNPSDVLDGVSLEQSAILQVHNLNVQDALLAGSFETPSLNGVQALSPSRSSLSSSLDGAVIVQTHLFSPLEMNFAFPFEAAVLGIQAQNAPGFRTTAITAQQRSSSMTENQRITSMGAGNRSNTIKE
jgi:hypothetical protein